jgi:hypothetical protein
MVFLSVRRLATASASTLRQKWTEEVQRFGNVGAIANAGTSAVGIDPQEVTPTIMLDPARKIGPPESPLQLPPLFTTPLLEE